MNLREWYIIGDYLDPSNIDHGKYYDDVLTAISKASDRSECNRNSVIAVWDNENRCVAIFINGDQFNAS